MELAIRGARVLLVDGEVEGDVVVSGGVISGFDGRAGREIDGRGLVLAPAMVDIHGDAFERQVMPRPGVFFPLEPAVLDTDRQLAANGIATAWHAVTLGWEPGLRSVERGRALIGALAALRPRLLVENRVQLRWETFAFEAEDLIEAALDDPLTPSIAFNDHTSMAVRSFDVPLQERSFEQSPDFSVAALDDARLVQRNEGNARRAGLSADDYIALLTRVWDRRGAVDAAIRRVAAMGRQAGAPMLSHDDTRPETRDYYRALGVTVAEFPMALPVAEAARAAGDHIAFGAPNAVRGGSHIGSLAAAEMVADGLCDALASDYFYPAMLAAIARLAKDGVAPRHALWRQVSDGPARAMGLADRGRIAPGLRADLVLLDWPEGGTPAVLMTLCAGRVAFRADPAGR